MAAIDDVIARSRRPGGFSQRRHFTLARQAAIRKMRQFALADPHFYVCELIQAAIGSGAQYVDIVTTDSEFRLSYVVAGSARASWPSCSTTCSPPRTAWNWGTCASWPWESTPSCCSSPTP